MKYCSKCGNGMMDDAVFCSKCGFAVGNAAVQTDATEEKMVLEAKGSMLGGGMGRIILTNKAITWTKSKVANFAAVGVLSFVTKGDTSVHLNTISYVDTWMFLGGGGLAVHTKDGKTYKFGFNSKKDRDAAMEYIQQSL